MLQNKLWVYNEYSEECVNRLVTETGISRIIAKILTNRGINDSLAIKKFLHPSLDDLGDPFLLSDMEQAVKRIMEALSKKEKIIIYGDYDVDGITSTSILYDFLKYTGADVDFFIPDRIEDGYGLSFQGVSKALKMGADLLITVDCGITAFEEVRYILDAGVDIIITDHHECGEDTPDAYAVINPCRHDCAYPFKELADGGGAYKLLQALCIQMNLDGFCKRYLDLVALGTVADVVPLVDENRVIVKYGLDMMESTGNVGLRSLIKNSALKGRALSSWVISFVLAPRINAAGRIGKAERAVKLFITDDPKTAEEIVIELNEENKYRQEVELTIYNEAVEMIESTINLKKDKVIVVAGDGWHHGIVGIVSSKITEKYHRPCILISCEDGKGKGSGRSIEGFNLYKALQYCESLLEKYGGHELAAGLLIHIDQIDAFREMINQYADGILTSEQLVPRVKIDACIKREDITLDNIKELEMLSPFGTGNPNPVFGYKNVKVDEIRTVGDNRHLKLRFEDKGFFLDGIGFNMGKMIDVFSNSDTVDAAGSLELNVWNSSTKIQINIKDLQFNEEIVMEDRYFYSLDKCINVMGLNTNHKPYDQLNYNNVIKSDENFISKITSDLLHGRKTAIMINSLNGMKNLLWLLKRSVPGIKKTLRICYTDFVKYDNSQISLIINPNPNQIDSSQFDSIILFGKWIDYSYLTSLTSQAEHSKVFFYHRNETEFNIQEIIPERQDLIAVYQYIKANYNDCLKIEDLSLFAKKIAKSYRIHMNYFKVLRSLEVFEELKLLSKEDDGEFGVIITMYDNKNGKTNLENSILYCELQRLKLLLKEA